MNFKEVEKVAREKFNGSCKVCKVCNGIACAGEVPGMGGKGSGSSFIDNRKSLEKIKINMRVIHNVSNPDITIELFGMKMDAPIFAAPITGTTLNMGGKISERDYIEPVVKGCIDSGVYAMVGDTAVDEFLLENLSVLKEYNGQGIVFIKPWENDDIINKIKLAEESNAIAVGVDIDACGLVTLSMHGKKVVPKTVEDLRKLKNSTKLPFIVKGIMTVEDALMAVEAGVDAIVISNHGGRVLDCTPGVCEVIPSIAKAVKGNLYIYNFPARSGHSIAPETLKKLVENNANIKGLKDSVSEPNHTNELMLAVEGHEFEMFSGFDDQFLYNLTSGGVGCIGALSNIVPEIWSDLVKSTKEKDFDRVMKLSALTHELMPLYDMDSNFSLLFKKLMQHRGVEVSERAIFPYNQMDEEVYKKAESLMDKVIEEYQNLK